MLSGDSHLRAPPRQALQGDNDMNDSVNAIEQSEDGILLLEVSDEALEAAASQTGAVAVMSFPNAPTVSILVMCCSNG
jgi:hypothetical protein